MQAVKNTIAENFGGASHDLAPKDQQFSLEDVPDLSGKVAIVTGGSQGIGYGCTHTLLSHKISKLFILSTSQEVVDGALSSLESEMGAEIASKVKWLQCDLTDWKAVAATAKKITDATDRVDILINNAARGIMTAQKTSYGVDEHMAANLIGHVVLTSHLLPVLKKTASEGNTVRIVGLGSNAHPSAPSDTKFASLDEINKDLGPNGQYGRSKLAVMLYAFYLARHLTAQYPKILVNTTHPGFVDTKASTTDIHEAYPLGGYAMSVAMKPFQKDQFMGCVSTMFAATKTEKSGQYITPPAIPEKGSSLAQDEQLGEQLMKLTEELIRSKSDAVAEGCPLKFY
ncbi:retinol dehydrogenase 12 [Coleophoma crateriformis]|uniref:Retinol dehydrogenase 12 n=1 Tax=Coleophoma crateriformis TaxID=565419 RepID=A0A3D8RNC4_9HELO|nr:retinol dehydrogenase 12 [Coleophoma crateriformis]